MRKFLYAILIVMGCSQVSQAAPGDTTWVYANNVQLDYFNNFDTTVAFPDASKTYRRIYMIFTLGKYVCPGSPQYCGDWDYTVQNYFMAKHATDTFELGRLITPYAHTNSGRFTANWTNRYIFDVTDYYPALHDTGTVRIHYSGYSGGFTANIKFAFIEGTPERQVLQIDRLWHGDFSYGHGTPINTALGTLNRTPPSGMAAASIKMNITGHGGDNTNCAEFCPNVYTLAVNGTQIVQQPFFRTDCSENDLYYQSGTWIYSRANWCPGALVRTLSHDLTVPAGSPYSIAMAFPAYTSTPSPSGSQASYTIDGAVIYYGATNKTLDAALTDIIAPTDAEYHWRENPTSMAPRFMVRNTGSATINSITIEYNVDGQLPHTFTWSLPILPFHERELQSIPLPGLSLSAGVYGFSAKIISINGTADDDVTNNALKSTFTAAPTWPADLDIQQKSNNEVLSGTSNICETSWRIEDAMGNIVKQKNDCPIGTICEDSVHLSDGAYRFIVNDSSALGYYDIPSMGAVTVSQGDGLASYSSTNGYIRVFDLNGFSIALPGYFAGNFGKGFTQYFHVGTPLAVKAVLSGSPRMLKVFPNPASTDILIVVDGKGSMDGSIAVTDITGRILMQKPYHFGILSIDASTLSNGLYQVVYSPADGQTTRLQQRVVISR